MGKKTASTSISGSPRAGSKVWIPEDSAPSLPQSSKPWSGFCLVLLSLTALKLALRREGGAHC